MNETLESKLNEMERVINETLESKINNIERVMNEKLEREISKNETLENKIKEMERVMNEKLERERLKNEILESKINEMERIMLSLSNNKDNQEAEKKIINRNSKKNLNEKDKEESNAIINEKGDLAVALYNYNGTSPNELTLHKNEYLIVTNWNIDDGYAFGYKRNDPESKGKFPTPLVRKCSENNKVNDNNNNSIDNNNSNISGHSSNDNQNNNDEGLPTYNDSVNVQPYVNATPMIYQNPNYYYPYAMAYPPSYMISSPPQVGTTSPYTVSLNANANVNPGYLHSMTPSSSLGSGMTSNGSVPTSSYALTSNIQQSTASSAPSAPPEASTNSQH